VYINLYGLNVVYNDRGRGPLVLLLAETAEHWADCEPLPPGYRFVVPDLPGFGRSEGSSLAPEELAEFVVALVTMLNAGLPRLLVRGVGEAVGRALAERMGLRPLPCPDRDALLRLLEAG